MKKQGAIKVRYDDVVAAVGPNVDGDAVWKALIAEAHNPFDGRRMIMWFGGVLALLASTIFLGTAGVSFGVIGFGLTLTAIMAALLGTGWWLKGKGHHLAGGLLATLFSGLVPLLVFSITDQLGIEGEFFNYSSFYDYISSQWIWMELVTIVVGAAVVWKFDFGFATLPPVVATYFFVMDFGQALFDAGFDSLSLAVGFVLGTAMLALAVGFERGDKSGHATWLLIYGLLSYLFAAQQVTEGGTAGALVYLGLGLAFLVFGWAIKRGIPVTIGGLAMTCSLAYLSFDYFDDSILFSLVVFVVGIGIVLGATFLGRTRDSAQMEPTAAPELR